MFGYGTQRIANDPLNENGIILSSQPYSSIMSFTYEGSQAACSNDLAILDTTCYPEEGNLCSHDDGNPEIAVDSHGFQCYLNNVMKVEAKSMSRWTGLKVAF